MLIDGRGGGCERAPAARLDGGSWWRGFGADQTEGFERVGIGLLGRLSPFG